jgi:VanZ family protein
LSTNALRYRYLARWLLFIAWGVIVLWFSLIPSPPLPKSGLLGWDKLQHAAAYALLTLLGYHAFASFSPFRHRLTCALAVAAVFGALLEAAQAIFTTTRSAELGDLAADIVGAGLACAVVVCGRSLNISRFTGGGNCMFRFISVLLVSIFISSAAWGDDNLFTSVSAIKAELQRFGGEAREVVTTPIDIEGHGLTGTLATAGAVGLTYVFDQDIRNKVQANKTKNLDRATDAGTILGDPFLHMGVAAAVYGGAIAADSPKYRELGEMLGESVLLADATTFVLKEAIGRGRPFVAADKGSFRPFQFSNDFDSLPSMHTASSFAMASVLAATSESSVAKLTYYAAATFVGFSRIYQDKHWASDVVLGAAVGELCGRVVTRYHGEHGGMKVALAPMATGNSASLALVGRW